MTAGGTLVLDGTGAVADILTASAAGVPAHLACRLGWSWEVELTLVLDSAAAVADVLTTDWAVVRHVGGCGLVEGESVIGNLVVSVVSCG